jgi:SAM-dependent methyltransferase
VSSESFWNEAWSDFRPQAFSADAVLAWAAECAPAYHRFLSLIGDVRGRDVLDLGCGNGFHSVLLAQLGARVVAVDSSRQATENARRMAAANGVEGGMEVVALDARRLEDLGRSFDVVTGTYVLHHIEPFEPFATTLRAVMEPGSRGVFYENSGRNRLLMLCRTAFTGRFGIPKFGDREEAPLAPAEIAVLERCFAEVVVHYPNFVFLSMAPTYLLRGNRGLSDLAIRADEAIYRSLPPLRRYSYHQIIEIRR